MSAPAPIVPSTNTPGTGRALGIHAKSSVRRLRSEDHASPTVRDYRVRFQWLMQRKAQGLLSNKIPKTDRYGNEVAGFRYRIAMCNRGTDGGPVDLKTSPDAQHAEYHGLQTCGSVWHCAICAPKIARERRDEMNCAIYLHLMGAKLEARNVERTDGKPRRMIRGEGRQRRQLARRGGSLDDPVRALERSVLGEEDRRTSVRRLGDRRHAERRQAYRIPDKRGILKVRPGGTVAFVTLTFPHAAEEGGRGHLAEQLGRLRAALVKLKSDREYRVLLQRAGFVGEVRALEVTYGEQNGWHPHTHSLAFIAHQATPALDCLKKIWARVLLTLDMGGLHADDSTAVRFGKLRDLLMHCCVVEDGTHAAAYVNKFGKEPASIGGQGRWGLASELTRGHLKQADRLYGTPARCAHASPWELLADATLGDEISGALFREFAQAFHGKRQLFWSPGLKSRLGLQSYEDETLAAEPDAQCTVHCMTVSGSDWSLLLAHNMRWDALNAACMGGREAVMTLLERLRSKAPTHSGHFTAGSAFFADVRTITA